jgi:hypothetical protein
VSARTPSYRHHKPSEQAVVTLDGRGFYLGRFGSPESRGEHDRLTAEWLLNGRRLSAPDAGAGGDLTVNELPVEYLGHADTYYVKNGRPTKEPEDLRYAIRPLRQLYGHTQARDFGPMAWGKEPPLMFIRSVPLSVLTRRSIPGKDVQDRERRNLAEDLPHRTLDNGYDAVHTPGASPDQ